MKLISCIKKNIKILLRSKGSALIVLLAPLIIVFIIGLGFMDNTEVKLNIGIHTKEQTELTQRYITAFNTTENNIIIYEQEEQCRNAIRDGVTVMCVIFSEDFEIRDGAKNELTFIVDESRINLVDKLISSFSTSLGTETSDISQEIAQQLLQIIEQTNTNAKESLTLIITNRAQQTNMNQELQSAKTTVTGIDTTKENINTRTIENKISDAESAVIKLRQDSQKLIDEAKKILIEVTDPEDLNESINKLQTTITTGNAINKVEDVSKAIKAMSTSINKITERLEKADTAKTNTANNLNKIQTSIETLIKNTEDIKIKQEQIINQIESFELRSARSITSPVNTKVESISTTNNRLTYSFSYLLTLAILFTALMLSSTLVYMEKDSKAYFRNFTTPTTQKYFIKINYLTSLIIIIIQTLFVLAIAHFALSVPILTNIEVTSVILLLGITFFITLGIVIGIISTTSEAVTMSTIVLGSVFLFLSNLILPLETLAPTISKIAGYNPFVIMSESIRKAMLFQSTFTQLQQELILLAGYTIIMITIMIIINKFGLKHFLATRRHKKNLLITEPEHLTLNIKNTQKKIKNIQELTDTLKTITEEEYQEIIKEQNPITQWLKETLRKKMLARRIKNKKLPEVIKKLEKHQKKKTNKNINSQKNNSLNN